MGIKDWFNNRFSVKHNPSRREFMKKTGFAAAGVALGGAGVLTTSTESEAGRDRYFADLPSAVRAYENSGALLNAFLATKHKMYHKTVHAPHGTSRDELIAVSLGLTNTNYNNHPVVSYEDRTASPLYFLLRARISGRRQNISGREFKDVLSVNPTAKHLILGLNQLYTWDGASWWRKLKPEKKIFDGANAKIHFARGIFEISQINQTDIEKINSRFNYSINSRDIQNFPNEFVNLPNEQKNWIFNNIVQNKLKPLNESLELTNLYWCLGMFYFSESFDKIKGNSSGKVRNDNGLYDTLRRDIFKYRSYKGTLMI